MNVELGNLDEDCGYDRDSRDVEPSHMQPTGSNPLFVGQMPDAIRAGQRRWLSKIVLQAKPGSEFAFCDTHKQLTCWDGTTGSRNSGFRDYRGEIHDPTVANVFGQRCHSVPVRAVDLADLDTSIGTMLTKLGEIKAIFKDMSESIEQRKRSKRFEEQSRHITIQENYH